MQQRQQTGGRGKAYLFLGVSLVAAVIAAVLVVQLLQNANRQVEQIKKAQENTVDVVVATRNLYMGLPIQEGDVAARALAPEMVPAEVVFTSVDEVLGRTPKERILANEILRVERLAKRDAGVGLNAIITPGKRAVSIAVKAEEAVAGFIQPRNYVDVIVVIKPDDKSLGAKAVATTLLQGIMVLAVGDSLGGPEKVDDDPKAKKKKRGNTGVVKGKRTVTLEVTPEEAQEIALAAARGEITLALRADIDILEVDTVVATATTLIGMEPKDEAPKQIGTMKSKASKQPTTAPALSGPQVISGSKVENTVVGEDGSVQSDKKKR
ncbi:MAG: Flp pilus assembly protein CpaB [Alphaproteobacteria bacterium]|nr:Flp pilus assembly protein CpaB [Alphaproteobacteria bacterium]MCB9793837.1 Flp pilus assembly protein CpaB [Alphaproteobacteria bacterium]